jgi:Fe-S oxidoreductase
MCPSFRVTRDEQHTTRGRANTLRLALSGQLGAAALASPAVREALALCVGCKGCNRECPTGIDMARMKIEVANQQRLQQGLARRDRLVAWLPRTLHSAALRRVFGWMGRVRNASGLAAAIAERLTGTSARRQMPIPAARAFLDGPARGAMNAAPPAPSPDRIDGGYERHVMLFVDTFTNHFEPDNATAAKRVLEAGGYTVLLATRSGVRPLCWGRTRWRPAWPTRCGWRGARWPRLALHRTLIHHPSPRACSRCATNSWSRTWATTPPGSRRWR